MNITRQTTPTPQKRRRALQAGGMASRLRGNDGGCMRVGYYVFDNSSGHQYVGKQTGPGANVVKASHVKFGEEVTFTASTQRGAVNKISADLGTNQISETNAQPLELLSAVVRDAQDNLLPNIPVVFTIEAGDASFPDSTGAQASTFASGPLPDKAAQRIVLNTDKNGLVALRPLIGNLEGTVRIKAQALKAETGNVNTASDLIGNATFLIQAKEAKDGPASFKGYVYDDKSRPLANVKVSIGRTALVSTTDANGLFQLDNIPPGRIDLFVDGRTVNPNNEVTKPQYPSLHFEAYAIKGRDNQIAHPIYLPPLSTSPESVKTVGGAEDVVLKIPGLAGFQMKVKANSVTFPDGSRVGTLIVSPVTADKLPMAPPAGGAQFGIPAWTVQPAGTRFDPPIEVTLPNASSQPAGDNLPIVQWDHDLGQYVAMGRATVSEDGSVLITDSGSGLTKAGWGGLCRYDPDKCGKNAPPKCTDCQKVDNSGDCPTCAADAAKNKADCTDGDKCGLCSGGNCFIDPNIKTESCCGGNKYDNSKSCCVKVAPSYMPNTVTRGISIKAAGVSPESCPDRVQNPDWPPGGPGGRDIDGCSVPGWVASLLFPSGIFVDKESKIASAPNPSLAGVFYRSCAAHDLCYQSCNKDDQGACDNKINEDMKNGCGNISDSEVISIPNPDLTLPVSTFRVKDICFDQVGKVYAGLVTFGFIAYAERQREVCTCCGVK